MDGIVDERLEGRRPRPDYLVADGGAPVDVRLDRAAELDRTVDHGAVGEREAKARPIGVRVGLDLDEPAGDELVDEAPIVVDHVEPAILDDAGRSQRDGIGVLEAETPNRGNRQAGDADHGGC